MYDQNLSPYNNKHISLRYIPEEDYCINIHYYNQIITISTFKECSLRDFLDFDCSNNIQDPEFKEQVSKFLINFDGNIDSSLEELEYKCYDVIRL